MKKAILAFAVSAILLAAHSIDAAPAFDHSAFNDILQKYVKNGAVDYASLKADRAALDAYLERLGNFERKSFEAMERNDRIAFLLNAYNAITLQAILDHYPMTKKTLTGFAYPVNSIRQIPGVWDRTKHKVAGEEMTLNHIEHEILRKEYKEPNVHMALVCASKGCPPLRSEAYEGKSLAAQFEDQARTFLADVSKFNIDSPSKTVNLNPIFNWFGDDFRAGYEAEGPRFLKGKEKAAVGYISRHVTPERQKFLLEDAYKVKFLDYDWSLNEKG